MEILVAGSDVRVLRVVGEEIRIEPPSPHTALAEVAAELRFTLEGGRLRDSASFEDRRYLRLRGSRHQRDRRAREGRDEAPLHRGLAFFPISGWAGARR